MSTIPWMPSDSRSSRTADPGLAAAVSARWAAAAGFGGARGAGVEVLEPLRAWLRSGRATGYRRGSRLRGQQAREQHGARGSSQPPPGGRCGDPIQFRFPSAGYG